MKVFSNPFQAELMPRHRYHFKTLSDVKSWLLPMNNTFEAELGKLAADQSTQHHNALTDSQPCVVSARSTAACQRP